MVFAPTSVALTAVLTILASAMEKEGEKHELKNIHVLTLPVKPDATQCFPQQYVEVSTTSQKVNIEECANYPDRKIALFDERVVISLEGKYGFCDSQGVIVVEPRFDFMDSFKDAAAVVRINGKYGYVGIDGKFIVEPQFDWAFSFHDGVGAVQVKNVPPTKCSVFFGS
jgi:hypothetical protein